MTTSARLRQALVAHLAGHGRVHTAPVRAAFEAVPRERFVPQVATSRGLAAVYADEALVVQERDGVPTSSSSQPSIMAEMLEALAVAPGHRVLEVGLGTGYNAALLAQLVGARGAVTSIDIDDTLVTAAGQALAQGGFQVEPVTADGRDGWAAGAPYDRIIVTASAAEVPRAWWDQLASGGLLLVPLRVGGMQIIPVLARTAAGFRSTRLLCGGFMPLRERADAPVDAQPVLTVRATVPGQPAADITAAGPGIVGPDGAARPTLAARLLSPPARRPVDPYGPSAVWHTALTSDPARQIQLFGSLGHRFGLVDPGTGGCCVLAAGTGDEPAVESYGAAPCAEAELLEHLRAWHDAGAPGLDDLTVQIDYHDLAGTPPDWALRTIIGGRQHLSIGWP